MKIPEQVYRKKVYYGWCGKFLGGNVGAPYEGIKEPKEYVPVKTDKINNLPNDDADYEIAWFQVMKEKGLSVTSCDLATFARDYIWYPFGEYGYSMKNIKMGIYPPDSGSFNNDYWSGGMGCPIRSEIWAYLFPGNPARAAEFALMDGQMDHGETSIWAEVFLSSMQSSCFLSTSLEDAFMTGLRFVPANSQIHSLVESVMEWSGKSIDTFEIRKLILENFGHPDFTNSVQNVGFTLLALLSGGLDFWKTMELALNFGYDTDCTCATAGATLGILRDEKSLNQSVVAMLPEEFVLGIDVQTESKNIKKLAQDVADMGIRFGALSPKENSRLKKTSLSIGHKSGAAVDYLDSPVVSTERWSRFKLLDPIFKKVCAVLPDPALDVKKTGGGYAVKIKDSVKEARDFYTVLLKNEKNSRSFGFAAAKKWYYRGPYFDMGEKKNYGKYPPHGKGMEHIPGITEVFSGSVSIDKEYADEKKLVAEVNESRLAPGPETKHFFCGSDIVDLDNRITMTGPFCAYVWSYFKIDSEEKIWVVVGNNNPFICWLDGKKILEDKKCKFWMPYNHEKLVGMKAGVHSIIFKVLRVDNKTTLSFALKEFAHVHHHRSHFKIGLKYIYQP